jgi:hypothetical protein
VSIPANIFSEWENLQAQVAAAAPLNTASRATVVAMQLNAAQLVNDVENAEHSLAGALDTYTSGVDPVLIIQGVLGVYENAVDVANLAQMRGIAGRVASNLDQLGPKPRPLPPWQQPVGFVLPPFPKLMQPRGNILTASDPPQVIIATIFRAPPSRNATIVANSPVRTP